MNAKRASCLFENSIASHPSGDISATV